MKKQRILAFMFAFGLLFSACQSKKEEQKAYQPVSASAINPEKRGKYLVDTNGCHDCHSPKKFTERGMEVDTTRILSGHPANEALPPFDPETAKSYILFSIGLTSATGPWGTSFAANLTPDATGIGTWSEEQFLTCIKKGLYKGLENSRPLLPPMPWEHYKNFTNDDLKAIFAYLKSIPAVENAVPNNIPPQ
ncbi:diheme cytochrome c-553 [Tamlana fucoidanivorans]|uniref:Diheme cytochrome c-553 n=1 Tax=Allotamlana fucoidanivorans TaxID=2583814 RepID=A0A5C4SL00_9FLAO|nr:c-type cytochrome [Tamlana fucoidanivorans]TNJ44638.1 diheme cytochrome c-553 [Tamlana fucoidanivorans]